MFTFNPRPKFTATVKVREPGSDDEQAFTGHFQALPVAETEALQGAGVPAAKAEENNRIWLHRIFTGWGDDLVIDGMPLPVTEENKTLLLDAPWIRTAITRAYFIEIQGFARKN